MCYISCYIPHRLCVFVVYLIVEYGFLISDWVCIVGVFVVNFFALHV